MFKAQNRWISIVVSLGLNWVFSPKVIGSPPKVVSIEVDREKPWGHFKCFKGKKK